MADQRSYPQAPQQPENHLQSHQPLHQQHHNGNEQQHHHHPKYPSSHNPSTTKSEAAESMTGSSDQHSAYQHPQHLSPRQSYTPRPDQRSQYRGHHRMADDDEDDDDEDDLDEDEDEDHPGFQSTYHSAYNTAYNSAYNSCDESEDVNMDGVVIKEDSNDQDMAEPPSTSVSSSSSFASFPNSQHSSQPHYTHHQPAPHPPQTPHLQQHQHRHSQHEQHRQSSQSSLSSNSTPSSTPSSNTKPTTLANIKPRPALRPLLPSRPTSPQPLIGRPGSHASEMTASKDTSKTQSSSLSPASGTSGTGTGTSASTGKTRQSAYKINGLNILNRNSLDSRTALEMIRRRRENHNHVERRRRDTLNSTILQIAEILPNCSSTAKLNKGTILRLALDHLRALHTENHSLRSENAALRFFYQGSQMRRHGPQGPAGSQSHPGQQGPAHSQHPHASTSRGVVSSSSGISTPPIIPGPGQGTIPCLASSAPPPSGQSQAQFGTNVPGIPRSTPGSAANSPPGQHTPYPGPSAPVAVGAVNNKRSMSTSGHLHPILPKSQASKISPSSSPRPRLLPHPSPNGVKPYSDAIRLGPSPLSSPCSSPPLAPMTISQSPSGTASTNLNALASALPTVPASHQHSAAVSAAAAAAAAAASAASHDGGHSSRSHMPMSTSTSVTQATAARHHKSSGIGGSFSSSGHSIAQQQHGTLPMIGLSGSSGAGSDMKVRKHSAQHSAHSSMSSSSATSSGTPSATTSPYTSPYPAPQNHQPHQQGYAGGYSPSSHPNYNAPLHPAPSLQPNHGQQQQQHYGHHPHHPPQGSSVTLPSIGTVTNPSSPMVSPHQAPHTMSSLSLPAPMSLPAPVMAHDSYAKHQHQHQHQGYGHGHGPGHPHTHGHPHPHDSVPILPPLAPR
ncbi:hypothetical protein BGX28_002688 [Mortierella sp. GBA30]|nr:hypothetical protein BGX28_002688 [Mortierella sp. GBA30]